MRTQCITLISTLALLCCSSSSAQEQQEQKEAPPKAIDAAPFTVAVPGTTYELEMLPIPAGTLPGSDTKIGPFQMSKTEIPWDLFDVFVYERDKEALENREEPAVDAVSRPSKPYIPPDRGFGHEGFPAISVRYKSAAAFCEWLSARTGKAFRLPTVEEWKYTALANQPFDPATLDDVAWHADNADWATHACASKKPNAFGLHDMLGNAAEWCVRTGEDGEDTGVLCGGHFDAAPEDVTPEATLEYDPSWQMMDPQVPKSPWWLSDGPFAGFRVICEEQATEGGKATKEEEDDDATFDE